MVVMARFHTIVTHVRPHFDEIVAIFLLKTYGNWAFPGIRNAKFEFIDAGSAAADGRTAEDWEKDGVLYIGVGHGRFDEHPTPGRPRIEDQSAASMVAKAIKIEHRGHIRVLVEYTTEHDTKGNQAKGRFSQFLWAPTIGMMNSDPDNRPQDVITWALKMLKAYDKGAKSYQNEGPKVLRQARVVPLGGDGSPTLAVIQSDNEHAWRYGWTEKGGRHAVILLCQPNGHMQIFTNNRYNFNSDDLAAGLRLAELAANGRTDELSREQLIGEGTLPCVPEWHYFTPTGSIFNGALTSPGTPATALSVDTVVALIVKHLEPQACPQVAVSSSTPVDELIDVPS